MATYVIGDLQGCFDDLQALLKHIQFDGQNDFLWFAGDIVNRGPQSLECLRFVKTLQENNQAQMVLGNHDIHLLASYAGMHTFASKSDTLDAILQAEDVDILIDWLRQQPLMLKHPLYNMVMVHAGIPPQWNIDEAYQNAQQVEAVLQQNNWQDNLVTQLLHAKPKKWHDALQGWERLRYILNALVRMRYCSKKGKLDFAMKASPEKANDSKYLPWFVHPNRRNKDYEIFFGHWSTLGVIDAYNIHSTDTGCLWGGRLSAYCIEQKQRYSVNCKPQKTPHG